MIYEFDPIIYPVKIWVSVTNDLSLIEEKFLHYPSLEFYDKNFEDKMERFTQMVTDRETRLIGILLVFRHKRLLTPGKVAHEVVHATRKIWGHLGEVNVGMEADAYLVEWIMECVELVKKGNNG